MSASISYRYGQRHECKTRNPDYKRPLTELEFRCAVDREIPICMFIMHPGAPNPDDRSRQRGRREAKACGPLFNWGKKDRTYGVNSNPSKTFEPRLAQSLIKLREVLDKRSIAPLSESQRPNGAGGDRTQQ